MMKSEPMNELIKEGGTYDIRNIFKSNVVPHVLGRDARFSSVSKEC